MQKVKEQKLQDHFSVEMVTSKVAYYEVSSKGLIPQMAALLDEYRHSVTLDFKI